VVVGQCLSAQQKPYVLQTGGNTMESGTAKKLNEHLGKSSEPREWGRALEALKTDLSLPNNHHGKIWSDGAYSDMAGKRDGYLTDYLN
jgi:filamentous hemagglutinin